jgi:uncharacterized protein
VIVLDTTVLVYAKGAEHEMRAPCRSLITAVASGDVQATTTAEVIQEFVHVRARRRGRADAAALGRDYAELFAPLISVSQEDLRTGLSLFESARTLGPFDAVLAAAAMARNATSLVSADRAFSRVRGLRHVVPDEAGLHHLLSG